MKTKNKMTIGKMMCLTILTGVIFGNMFYAFVIGFLSLDFGLRDNEIFKKFMTKKFVYRVNPKRT